MLCSTDEIYCIYWEGGFVASEEESGKYWGAGGSGDGKMETTVLEQELEKEYCGNFPFVLYSVFS